IATMNERLVHNVAANARMRTNPHLIHISVSLTFSLIAAIALLIVTGCKKSGAAGKPADVDYYTCTMHPSVKSQDPKGKCPICGMNLVPVMKKNRGTGEPEKRGNADGGHEHISGPTMPSPVTNAMQEPSEFSVPTARQQQI